MSGHRPTDFCLFPFLNIEGREQPLVETEQTTPDYSGLGTARELDSHTLKAAGSIEKSCVENCEFEELPDLVN